MNKEKVARKNCFAIELHLETSSSGEGQLVCNTCGEESYLSKEEVAGLLNQAGWFDSFKPKSVMQATICYDSIESATGPMTLGMLYDAVTEALEKGMPKDSEVFNSHTEQAIEGVRFLFETEKVRPIQCGEHMTTEYTDLLIDAHECDPNE